MIENQTKSKESGPSFTRRAFVKLGLSTVAVWLSGCREILSPSTPPPTSPPPTSAPPTPTDTIVPDPIQPTKTAATPVPPTYTPVPATPTLPPPPTATPSPSLNRAVLTAHWPATATSRVVAVRHSGVWAGGSPDSGIVLQMLDAGLSTLTDVPDPLAVWRTLFDPWEQVLLKVNCIAYNGPTQPAITYAVAQRLQDAGLAAENMLIFDRSDDELASAGYSLNDGGAGIQCRGNRGTGSQAALSQATVSFYREFDDYGAIINIPTPKQHSGAGISVSLKNHYGSVNRPGALHGNWCNPAIAELNAQPNIRAKTRLVVCAALNVSPFDWNAPVRESALLLSFDPVALDTVGRDILVRHRQALDLGAGYLIEGALHLQTAQSLGLGATEAAGIDLREVTLG